MGTSIASASGLFLLLALTYVVFQLFLLAPSEERYCLEKYGETYREYLNRTPRWLGLHITAVIFETRPRSRAGDLATVLGHAGRACTP